jgi:uncharacterized BrkB/YihY/UPF0761 family membrane protein
MQTRIYELILAIAVMSGLWTLFAGLFLLGLFEDEKNRSMLGVLFAAIGMVLAAGAMGLMLHG